MSGTSITAVNAKLIADAKQFIAEFERADNASRRSAANIDREVGNLQKSLSKKFALGDIGKDVLRGFGIGSGFAVAQTAADMLVKHFADAAESAKAIEESTAAALAHTKAMIAFRQTDAQQAVAVEKEMADIWKRLEEARRAGRFSETGLDANFKVVTRTGERPLTAEQQAEVAKLEREYEKLEIRLRSLRGEKSAQQILDQKIADDLALTISRRRELEERILEGNKLYLEELETQKKAREEADKLAEKWRRVAEPLREYREELEQIARLHSSGDLTDDQSWAAQVDVMAREAEAIEKLSKTPSRQGLKDISPDQIREAMQTVSEAGKQFEQQMSAMWANVSDRAGQAFADVVLTGKGAFGDLVDIVARSVVEIAAQLLIINPILNGLFGNVGGFKALPAAFDITKLLGFADGGRPPVGVPSLVGERGPELFVPDRGGTIVPNHALSGGSRGNTYVIDARGTDESVVQRLQQALMALAGPGVVERRSVAAVSDARRRGIA